MKTFLENLKQELESKGLNQQEIDEIIKDHEEMINEAMEEGLSEDELTAKFGNPKDLAEELAETLENVENKAEGDPDLNTVFEAQDIKSVNINLLSEDIEVGSTDGDKVLVYAAHYNEKDFKIYVEDNTLYIKRNTLKSIKFRIIRNSTDFKILIPKNLTLFHFTIITKSSDFDINNIKAEYIKLDTLSGDIDINHIKVDELKVKTISGDVDMSDVMSKDMSFSLVSGDIEMDHVTIENDLSMNTVSGDIEINDSKCNALNYNSVSGDFEGVEFYPKKVSLKSVSGDIEIKNKDKEQAIEVLSKKSLSGDIHIH